MVISADGLVLTNNHVIDGSKSIRVTLTSNARLPATVLGYDSTHDVACSSSTAPRGSRPC